MLSRFAVQTLFKMHIVWQGPGLAKDSFSLGLPSLLLRGMTPSATCQQHLEGSGEGPKLGRRGPEQEPRVAGVYAKWVTHLSTDGVGEVVPALHSSGPGRG